MTRHLFVGGPAGGQVIEVDPPLPAVYLDPREGAAARDDDVPLPLGVDPPPPVLYYRIKLVLFGHLVYVYLVHDAVGHNSRDPLLIAALFRPEFAALLSAAPLVGEQT